MPAAAPGGGASRRRSAAGQGGKRSRRVRQDHRHALLLAPSSAWYIARRAQRSVRSVRVVEWRVRVRVRCRFDLMRMRVRIFWRPVFGDVINAPRRPVAVGATSTPPSPPPAALLHAFCFACFLHAFCTRHALALAWLCRGLATLCGTVVWTCVVSEAAASVLWYPREHPNGRKVGRTLVRYEVGQARDDRRPLYHGEVGVRWRTSHE